jgi:hypothetical protein
VARPLPPGTVGAAQARRTQRRHGRADPGTASTQACFWKRGWGRGFPGLPRGMICVSEALVTCEPEALLTCELLTCELTLDAMLEVVLVLSLVLCGAHRVPASAAQGRFSRRCVMCRWGGRSWLEARPHIQCEVTMCDSAVICAPTAAGLLGRCARAFRDGAETVHRSGGA